MTTMTTATAADLIARLAGFEHGQGVLGAVAVAKIGIREALRRTHPDMAGGSRESFEAVQTARKVLTAHHGVSL